MSIIESRPGSGNYVVRVPSSAEEDDAVYLIESEAGCREMMEAREALEPPGAALVAGKRSSEVLSELKWILGSTREHAARDDFESHLDADEAFHFALAEAAGNPLVTAALSPLLNSMDQRVYRGQYYLKNVDDLETVSDLHSDILDAIERSDGDTAFAKMVEHWTRMREIWEA